MASAPFDRDPWKKRVSANAAGALILFALLHILSFAAASNALEPGVVRTIGFAVPVATAIWAANRFETRWTDTPELSGFRRAAVMLWAVAAVAPFLWSGMLRLIA